ncbi:MULTISPECIES: hypothetical protein [Methanobacterium]|uniref:Uncharacterized protein n=1 Tax=Methanobacterium bryantii TaxID=2161 RepID=A0A2A2H875_METBR|nr:MULTISPECIES: hypothetical protein [Methanobacterium]OEC84385.1 hypothetical protein A9507_02270 [Methanobacterium sp. A39]PAV05619.1 hypothetical protein ASJ80_08910 [Methanobacterium bryantii]
MVLKYISLEEETEFNKIVHRLLEEYDKGYLVGIEIQLRDVTYDEWLLSRVIYPEKAEKLFLKS